MLKKKIKNLFKKRGNHLSTIEQQPIQIQDVKDFVANWNINFPIDRWWREKYNVAFNSPEHREVSFLDMRIEWEEDRLISEVRNKPKYILNSGDFMDHRRLTKETENKTEQELQQEFEREFKNMDLSQFDELK